MQKLIFIVDDNDTNLAVAASVLEDEYRVLTMPSAKKMFSLLEKKQPDIILLDIEMPEMNGFDAIYKLKEHTGWRDIPVIFFTGWSDSELESRALKSGALEIISKPVVPSVLLNCIKNYI